MLLNEFSYLIGSYSFLGEKEKNLRTIWNLNVSMFHLHKIFTITYCTIMRAICHFVFKKLVDLFTRSLGYLKFNLILLINK